MRRLLSIVGLMLAHPLTAAAEAPTARFVVIVGNNQSLDLTIPNPGTVSRNATLSSAPPIARPLEYADDDALLFAEVLRPHVAQLELLTVLDDDSQRRHPNTVQHARVPTRAELLGALRRTYRAIETSSGATELIFIFVGHGSVDSEGKGYVHLQDGPFTRTDLFAEVVAQSPADFTHIIVDACNAFSLVGGRGEDSSDLSLDVLFESFLAGHQLEGYPKVGVLAATSENRETHEWSRIASGIFSYQVRSALVGAADVNADGLIEYSEIAAFIDAANAEITSLGKRISVFAWPPKQDRRHPLIRLDQGKNTRQVLVSPKIGGRLYLEHAATGERWAGFHSRTPVSLVLPAAKDFFLRDDQHEQLLAAGSAPLFVEQLEDQTSVSMRGAVDQIFERGLFAVPYSRDYYRGFVGARSHFISVRFPSAESVENSDDPFAIAWSAGGLVGPAAVSSKEVEVGAQIRTRIPVADWLSVDQTLEGGYLGVRPGVSVSRFSLFVGASARVVWDDRFGIAGGVDLGWSIIAIDTAQDNVDYTIPSARARVGGAVRLFDSIWLQLSGFFTGYLTTVTEGEEARFSPQAFLGIEWRR